MYLTNCTAAAHKHTHTRIYTRTQSQRYAHTHTDTDTKCDKVAKLLTTLKNSISSGKFDSWLSNIYASKQTYKMVLWCTLWFCIHHRINCCKIKLQLGGTGQIIIAATQQPGLNIAGGRFSNVWLLFVLTLTIYDACCILLLCLIRCS